MNCPRCQQTLTAKTINEVKTAIKVDSCLNCGGLWMGKDELTQVDSVIAPKLIEIRHLPSEAEQHKRLHCPCCNNSPRLEKRVHPRDSKVIFDYCPYCKGIWLDKGELEAIQQENWLITAYQYIRQLT
ncbi:zf-TFIIB domain-containing protein [Carboxylicivirga taeanensis]|uniref:TFIIB-type zinc ribbon-containing protein n=1 Tax=Carboxylicivirga taeanensis TaxID=1416875 RepID=UPI003F6DD6EE